MVVDGKKRCADCKQTKPTQEFVPIKIRDGFSTYCYACLQVQAREYRKTDKHKRSFRKWSNEAYPRYRNKKIAAAKVRGAIQAGQLVKPDTCSRCGAESDKIEGHHPDYSKPLEVIWYCFLCHKFIHGRIKDSLLINQIAPKPNQGKL